MLVVARSSRANWLAGSQLKSEVVLREEYVTVTVYPADRNQFQMEAGRVPPRTE